MQPTITKHARSVVGPALVGIGVFILSGNLDRAVAEVSGLEGGLPRQALGSMPAAIVAASRVLQDYATDHRRFLQLLLMHFLALLWPMLLVVIGAVLSPHGPCSFDESRSGRDDAEGNRLSSHLG